MHDFWCCKRAFSPILLGFLREDQSVRFIKSNVKRLSFPQDTPLLSDELPSQPDIPPPQIPSMPGPSNLGNAHAAEEHVRSDALLSRVPNSQDVLLMRQKHHSSFACCVATQQCESKFRTLLVFHTCSGLCV